MKSRIDWGEKDEPLIDSEEWRQTVTNNEDMNDDICSMLMSSQDDISVDDMEDLPINKQKKIEHMLIEMDISSTEKDIEGEFQNLETTNT